VLGIGVRHGAGRSRLSGDVLGFDVFFGGFEQQRWDPEAF